MGGSPQLPYGGSRGHRKCPRVAEASTSLLASSQISKLLCGYCRMNCRLWSVSQKWKCGFEVWEVPLVWCGHRVHRLRQRQYFPGSPCQGRCRLQGHPLSPCSPRVPYWPPVSQVFLPGFETGHTWLRRCAYGGMRTKPEKAPWVPTLWPFQTRDLERESKPVTLEPAHPIHGTVPDHGPTTPWQTSSIQWPLNKAPGGN